MQTASPEQRDDVDRALASLGVAPITYFNFHNSLRRIVPVEAPPSVIAAPVAATPTLAALDDEAAQAEPTEDLAAVAAPMPQPSVAADFRPEAEPVLAGLDPRDLVGWDPAPEPTATTQAALPAPAESVPSPVGASEALARDVPPVERAFGDPAFVPPAAAVDLVRPPPPVTREPGPLPTLGGLAGLPSPVATQTASTDQEPAVPAVADSVIAHRLVHLWMPSQAPVSAAEPVSEPVSAVPENGEARAARLGPWSASLSAAAPTAAPPAPPPAPAPAPAPSAAPIAPADQLALGDMFRRMLMPAATPAGGSAGVSRFALGQQPPGSPRRPLPDEKPADATVPWPVAPAASTSEPVAGSDLFRRL